MIVVINPNGSGGHSFKGLHAYCAHDSGQAETSERVDWVSTRNVASDPEKAWKVMAATQLQEQQLKKAAGVTAGRKAKQGAVMHIVMSFDEDEPQTREAMEAAADGLLASLGADPAKMRGKAKPKRRQFADEHQAVIYAHSDTGSTHLHLMVNTVHPETGIRLPTSNDQLKASKWALAYSQEHGTDHKTPARQENAEMRENGEYVKANKRQSRNHFEEERGLRKASNDNDRVKAFLADQKAKDTALYEKGRQMADAHQKRSQGLLDTLAEKKEAAQSAMKARINRAKAAVREAYRPQWRELNSRQEREARAFEGLESTFWGRAKNTLKTFKQAYEEQDGVISKSFRILSSAGERKAYFDRTQARQRRALELEQSKALKADISAAKSERSDAYAKARTDYLADHKAEESQQAKDTAELRQDWKKRNEDRAKAIAQFESVEPRRDQAGRAFSRNRMTDEYYRNLADRMMLSDQFKDIDQKIDPSQDNKQEKGDGQER